MWPVWIFLIGLCFQEFAFASPSAAEPSLDQFVIQPDPTTVIASVCGAIVLMGTGTVGRWLWNRHYSDRSESNSIGCSDTDSLAIDLASTEDCGLQDVMISVEFLPSSPSSQSGDSSHTDTKKARRKGSSNVSLEPITPAPSQSSHSSAAHSAALGNMDSPHNSEDPRHQTISISLEHPAA